MTLGRRRWAGDPGRATVVERRWDSDAGDLMRAGGGATARFEKRAGLEKRSFSLAGHRTSVALEPEFWTALLAMAESRGLAPSAMVASVDAGRTPGQPLASALRVAALLHAGSRDG